MKSQNHKKLFCFQLLAVLIPGLLWCGLVSLRTPLISPSCQAGPNICSKESVFSVDRLSLGMEDEKADEYSFFTQNLSGVLALVIPILWMMGLVSFGRMSGKLAGASLVFDLIIVFQTITWNGFFTELSHLLSQRPRPFVYSDPFLRGIDPAHYTSFYSGHTSFTAATQMILFLILLRRKAPISVLFLAFGMGESLVFSTAYFRILAGRHFFTDVLCGALAGTLIAYIVDLRAKRYSDPIQLRLFSDNP